MARVCILVAQGFEEMEMVIAADMLRRAGAEVALVTLAGSLDSVTGSRGIRISPDIRLADVSAEQIDLLILPGGLEGTDRLGNDERVLNLVREVNQKKRLVAAICAAPSVLVKAGIADNRRLTSHPGTVQRMVGCEYQTARVVVDGNIVTSRAAGTTFEFAAMLIKTLFGPEKVKEVNKGVLAPLPEHLPELMA